MRLLKIHVVLRDIDRVSSRPATDCMVDASGGEVAVFKLGAYGRRRSSPSAIADHRSLADVIAVLKGVGNTVTFFDERTKPRIDRFS